jgi:essential nuclear protein 1
VEEYQPHRFKQKEPKKRKIEYDDHDGSENIVDTRASKKIISLGRDLAEEDSKPSQINVSHPNSAFDFNGSFPREQNAEDETYENQEDEEVWEDEDSHVMDVDVNNLPAISVTSDVRNRS